MSPPIPQPSASSKWAKEETIEEYSKRVRKNETKTARRTGKTSELIVLPEEPQRLMSIDWPALPARKQIDSTATKMEDKKGVDPQYLHILPKYFEVTPKTKRVATAQFLSHPSSQIEVCFYLLSLAQCATIWCDRGAQEEAEMKARHMQHPELKKLPFAVFFFLAKCFDALRHIGLDVHGGLERLQTPRLTSMARDVSIDTNALIVVDEEKAAKYVNLGVKLDAKTLMHANATTLEEGAKNYAQIMELTAPGNEKPMTMMEIEEKIETVKDTYRWEWKREKFRMEARRGTVRWCLAWRLRRSSVI